jgi:primase-polymerase (primpol)-like protein
MKIYSSDGKEFGKDNMTMEELADAFKKCSTYEEELNSKKAKAEAEKKEREQKKKILYEQIKSEMDKINKLLDEYKKSDGRPLWVGCDNGKIYVDEYISCSSLNYDWVKNFREALESL